MVAIYIPMYIGTYVHICINVPMMVKKNVNILGPRHIFAMHYYNTL